MIRRYNLKNKQRGFALVMTLSLMVLLTVLVVGLLSLSASCLRESSNQRAMATARADARLALMLALGALQKSMGPDKRVSASSEILGSQILDSEASSGYASKRNLTGVWESWNYNPKAAGLDYTGEKTRRFKTWLVSDNDPTVTSDPGYPSRPQAQDAIELVGAGSLGGNADESQKVKAGRVALFRNGQQDGGLAWQVTDEAAKARINSYRDPGLKETLAKKCALLTGHRPDPAALIFSDPTKPRALPTDDSPANYTKAVAASGKLLDLNQLGLVTEGPQIGRLRNALTPYSMGVMTNVREGGLKEDLTAIFESADLPAKYAGQKLYASTHKITGISDPNWSALAGYYNSYKKITAPDISPVYACQPDSALNLTATQLAPEGFSPGPVIAKVEILYSFLTRDAHWGGILSQGMSRMGHLIYIPLVTLHNPYNINISFDRMQVVIRNPPVGFNFSVNGQQQNVGLVSMSELYINNTSLGRGSDARGEKSFALDIGNWTASTSSATSGPIVLKPGQTMVSGPYLNPDASFDNQMDGTWNDWTNTQTGVDRATGQVTTMLKGKPGFAGKAVGFDIDWLTPLDQVLNTNDQSAGVLGLHPQDLVRIEFGIKQPTYGMKDRFQVTASLVSDGKTTSYGGMDFVYGDAATLGKIFNKTFFFPQEGGFAADMAYNSNRVPLKALGNAKAFALFSAYARTTNGGVYETNKRTTLPGALNALRDGRLAGKPYADHNPASTVIQMDMQKEVPGMQPFELNLVPLPGNVDDILEIDADNRVNVLTGNTTTRGIKSGSYLELPLGPMQTIADFRRSNALTTPFLPSFTQPVANSRVSPLMSTDSVYQVGLTHYELLDHSVLANHALYDRFFFSTIAPLYDKAVGNVLNDFLDNKAPLRAQSIQAYLPGGRTTAQASAELVADGKPTANAFQLAAEYMMVKGPFTVNSTSVQAWKAVLSTLNKSEIPILWPKNPIITSDNPSDTPILSMSLVNGGSATAQVVDTKRIDNIRANQWNGYRELYETQVEDLAREIVAQVKARGPFLSLSEFVNRRIGANSELTRRGALQTAIDRAKVNDAVFASQIPVTAADLGNPAIYRYKTVENALGNPAEGAPGWISQGDIMHLIEPLATVRGDTFVIRTCGEATDANGKVTARAYAEAVVQRIPEYLNPVDRPSVNVYDAPNSNPINRMFGRRLRIVSFRWLSKDEV